MATDKSESVISMSASEMAAAIGVDPKTFRRFVRDGVRAKGGVIGADTPGQGRRYVFTSDQIDSARDAFALWRTSHGRVNVTFDSLSVDESAE